MDQNNNNAISLKFREPLRPCVRSLDLSQFDSIEASTSNPLVAIECVCEVFGEKNPEKNLYICCSLGAPFGMLKCLDEDVRVASFSLLNAADAGILFPVSQNTAKIHSLCIVRRSVAESKELVEKFLLDNQVSHEQVKSTSAKIAANLHAVPNRAKIIFQVYELQDAEGLVKIGEPVEAEISIVDPPKPAVKADVPLAIFKSSRLYGNVHGKDIVIVLTSHINPEEDISVEFYKEVENSRVWSALAVGVHAHGSLAISFYTPSFVELYSILEDTTMEGTFNAVQFRLKSNSTGQVSNSVNYYFASHNELAMLGGESCGSPAPPEVKHSRDVACQAGTVVYEERAILVHKMNNIAFRTSAALQSFAKTRLFSELLNVNRHLLADKNELGNTPLHTAILYGHFDVLDLFVRAVVSIPPPYRPVVLMNQKNKNGFTPLMVAAYLGSSVACETLLAAGIPLTDTDVLGNNIAHVASSKNYLNVLRVVIKHARARESCEFLSAHNNQGFSPLHVAVLRGHREATCELVANEDIVDINVGDRTDGYTALHFISLCATRAHLMAPLICAKTLKVDAQSVRGATPLHAAIINTNYLSVVNLLRKGADKNTTSHQQLLFDVPQLKRVQFKVKCLQRSIECKLAEWHAQPISGLKMVDSFTLGFEISAPFEQKVLETFQKYYLEESDPVFLSTDDSAAQVKATFDARFYAGRDLWMNKILDSTDSVKDIHFLLKCLLLTKLKTKI